MTVDPKISPHVTVAMKPNAQDIYDLSLTEDGNLDMAFAARAVALHVRWRLMTFEGEWFLDVAAGMRWLEDIMGKRYNPALSEVMVKNEVFDTEGVEGINSLTISHNQTRRDLMIREMDVATIYQDLGIWLSNVRISV